MNLRQLKILLCLLAALNWSTDSFSQDVGEVVVGGGVNCQITTGNECCQIDSSELPYTRGGPATGNHAYGYVDGEMRGFNEWCVQNNTGFNIFIPTGTFNEFQSFITATTDDSPINSLAVIPCCDLTKCASHNGDCNSCINEGLLGPSNCCEWFCTGPNDVASLNGGACCRISTSLTDPLEVEANGACPVIICGDGFCSVGEDVSNCCQDCPQGTSFCSGNGCCANLGETPANCCNDCGAAPSDGTCSSSCGEDCDNSPIDCACSGTDVCNAGSCCTPLTCGSGCGSFSDGCGGTLTCGACSCTGGDDTTNATLCSGDDSGLTADTPKTLVAACTAGTSCEFTCDAGYTLSGSMCIPSSFVCTGGDDTTNATLCSGDDSGLTADTPETLVAACTAGTSCEFTCDAGYTLSGGVCAPSSFVCTAGDDTTNASLCPGDDSGLTADTPETLVATCTAGTKCEFTCDAGYSLSGGVCTAIICNTDGNCDPGEDNSNCLGDCCDSLTPCGTPRNGSSPLQYCKNMNDLGYGWIVDYAIYCDEPSELCVNTLACDGKVFYCKPGGGWDLSPCGCLDGSYTPSTEDCDPPGGSTGSCNWGAGESCDASCKCAETFVCKAGDDTTNATICLGDDSGLTADTPETVVATCTAGTKCEFTCDAGYSLSGGVCVSGSSCGDGAVQLGEQCDEGLANGPAPAYCDTSCQVNPYFITCGNGVLDPGEACDDGEYGNTVCEQGGSCNIDCTLNPSPCPGGSCGNGNLDAGEECDSGTANNGACPNNCSATCTNNIGCAPCPDGHWLSPVFAHASTGWACFENQNYGGGFNILSGCCDRAAVEAANNGQTTRFFTHDNIDCCCPPDGIGGYTNCGCENIVIHKYRQACVL